MAAKTGHRGDHRFRGVPPKPHSLIQRLFAIPRIHRSGTLPRPQLHRDLAGPGGRPGFTAGYQSVRRFMRELEGNSSPEARAVIETAAGEEAQVDYGMDRWCAIRNTGKYRRVRMFVMTLGCSRKSVRLLTLPSSSHTWTELHEQAFRRLGGASRVIVLDNLSEGVLAPDIYDPTLNPLYRDMLAHYGAIALPCRVRDPDRKAYVSYCTSSCLREGESRLFGAPTALAF